MRDYILWDKRYLGPVCLCLSATPPNTEFNLNQLGRAGQSWAELGQPPRQMRGGMGWGVGASWARPRSCCGRGGLATTQWSCTGAGHTLLSGAGKLSWSNCSSKRIIIDHGHCLLKTLEITFKRENFGNPKRICGAVISRVQGCRVVQGTTSSCLHPANWCWV